LIIDLSLNIFVSIYYQNFLSDHFDLLDF
jgi:hypothetical protein